MRNLEVLRPHLGDELFAQVSERLAGVEGLDIANTVDGSWIPKAKFDEERSTSKAQRTTIAELNKKLEEAEKAGADIASLKAQVEQLTKDVSDRDAQITTLQRTGKVKDILRGANARDVDVVLRLIDFTKIGEENGELTGATEQVDALKQSASYLFGREQYSRGGFSGGKETKKDGGNAGGTGSTQDVNAAIRAAAGRNN